MPLNDTRLRTLKPAPKPIKLSDGGGLHIHVAPSGAKLWRMAYRFDGRQKLLSFGAYPATSLAAARKRRDQAKELIAAGVDPGARAKAEKQERLLAGRHTFAVIADEFLEKSKREGRADVTVGKKRWLLDMAKAAFGKRPIRDITATDILVPLRKVEKEGNLETAKRLRAVIGQVFPYAVQPAPTSIPAPQYFQILTSYVEPDLKCWIRSSAAALTVVTMFALANGRQARRTRWTDDRSCGVSVLMSPVGDPHRHRSTTSVQGTCSVDQLRPPPVLTLAGEGRRDGKW